MYTNCEAIFVRFAIKDEPGSHNRDQRPFPFHLILRLKHSTVTISSHLVSVISNYCCCPLSFSLWLTLKLSPLVSLDSLTTAPPVVLFPKIMSVLFQRIFGMYWLPAQRIQHFPPHPTKPTHPKHTHAFTFFFFHTPLTHYISASIFLLCWVFSLLSLPFLFHTHRCTSCCKGSQSTYVTLISNNLIAKKRLSLLLCMCLFSKMLMGFTVSLYSDHNSVWD